MVILTHVAAGIASGVAFSAGAEAFETHLGQRVKPYLPLLLLGAGLYFLSRRKGPS